MPVIKTTDLIAKTVPEIPFQGEGDSASVWGRSLGNLEADKLTSMKISHIPLTSSFSVFMIMRKVAEPIAPIINEPILSSEGIWSLSWIGDVTNPNLSFDFHREYLDEEDEDFEYLYPATLSEKLTLDEWYLVELSSNPSKIKLKASNLKIGNEISFEVEGIPGKLLNSSILDINWNGVEIAELLIYNNNIDSTEVTSYLTKKYKALN
ncbi:MAG: hypothetical protein GX829_11740 [Clostridium sp.]|nr:hypothetical protein [Clostridium sp.]